MQRRNCLRDALLQLVFHPGTSNDGEVALDPLCDDLEPRCAVRALQVQLLHGLVLFKPVAQLAVGYDALSKHKRPKAFAGELLNALQRGREERVKRSQPVEHHILSSLDENVRDAVCICDNNAHAPTLRREIEDGVDCVLLDTPLGHNGHFPRVPCEKLEPKISCSTDQRLLVWTIGIELLAIAACNDCVAHCQVREKLLQLWCTWQAEPVITVHTGVEEPFHDVTLRIRVVSSFLGILLQRS